MFGRSGKKEPTMRIFFASDFHGSTVVFKKFLNAAEIYKANILVFGGDITGKAIIPIVGNGKPPYETISFGQQKTLNTDEEVASFIKVQSNTGYYPKIMTKEEYEEISQNQNMKMELFHELMVERVKEWVSIANERLKTTGIKLYMEAGNDDLKGIEQYFNSEVSQDIGEKVVDIDGYTMAGISEANMTPWHAPRDVEEEDLWKIISKQLSQVDPNEKLILAYHPPPKDTNLDLAPKIERDLRYTNVGGQQIMIHVGSTSVRRAIEEWSPIVSLHGHIHESRGIDKIGKTVCINPGSEYTEGVLHGGLVILKDRDVINQILVTG
ncbi:MAG: metallophosphoesterase [Thermoplasmatales archaeon]